MNWTESQLNAINISNTNIIVSAGAGSGKTAVLTTRIIEKIKKGTNINELLVLTFTKAAAREMKERVRKALIKEKLTSQLLLLDASYITTFDSFALSIVKKYHYVLNIGKDIIISPDSLMQIVVINELNKIFDTEYLNKDEGFLNLISDFCVKSDDKIRKAIINLYNKLDQKIDKMAFLNTYFDEVFNDDTIVNNVNKYQEIIKDKILTIIPLFDNLLSEASFDCYEAIKLLRDNLLHADTYDRIKTIIENRSLPTKKKECGENYSLYRKDLVTELKKLDEYVKYDDQLEMTLIVNKTYAYQKTIIDLLIKLETSVSEYKKDHQLYNFYDVARLAILLVKDNPEICESTKGAFKEILIDEYQDTSDIQEQFINLISNNNVYMVGDIKQSIYRFRNANPTLFKNRYDLYDDVSKAKESHGIKIDLLENFRSRNEVLQAINDIFQVVMSDQIGGANYKSRHKMIYGNMQYDSNKDDNLNYQIEVLNYSRLSDNFTKVEKEAFAIADDIKNKIVQKIHIYDKNTKTLRPVKLSDFAILIDRGTEFDTYKKIFEYLGLPLHIFTDVNLNEGYDLLIIKNIMKFVFKIKDKEYDTEYKYLFMSIARSFLFAYDDETIYSYIMNNDIYNSEVYQIAWKITNRLPALNGSGFVETIIDEFHYLDKVALVGDVDQVIHKIDYLITLANSLNEGGLNINEFINHLDEVINEKIDIKYSINIGETEAIRLMTIHKSKGLEFPICYYPGLSSRFNTSDAKEQFILDNELGLICPYFENGIKETIYKDIYKYNYNYQEISERIRLFYVALTRAQEKIILVDNLDEVNEAEVNESYKLRYKSFKNIMDSVYNILSYQETITDCPLTDKYKISKAIDYLDDLTSGKVINTINITNSIKHDDKAANQESRFSKHIDNLLSKNEYEKIKLGNEIHHILESLDFSSPTIVDDIRKLKIDGFYQDKIITFVNSIDKNKLKNAKVYQEYEFIDDNKHGIIDLMIEYHDYIDIIDYKLKQIDDDAYLKQLKGYEKYISGITNKKINTYLYSIIEGIYQKV